jgi:hypothetical protein
MLHFYDGPLTGSIQLRGRQLVPCTMAAESLASMAEDTIHEFRAEA